MISLQGAQLSVREMRKPAQTAAAQVSLAPKGERTCAMSAQAPLLNRSKPAQLAANNAPTLGMREGDAGHAKRPNARASRP